MNRNYLRLLPLLFALISIPTALQGQLSGWSYNISIDIINKTATARSNYQELVVVNTSVLIAAGQMQSNGADIRFGDKCSGSINLLSHYVMADLNTDSTKIWVMVPSIPANSTVSIFLFYGNSAASSTSSFSAVFPNAKKSGGPNDSIGGVNTYDWFELEANDTLFIKKHSIAQINARVAIITGAIIGSGAGEYSPPKSSDGKGSGAGYRSSAGNAGSGGAGYGGNGGDGGYDAGDNIGVGGTSYGTSSGTDIALGSSGASSDLVFGGAGGGSIIIKADYLQFSGSIICNGLAGGGLQAQNGGGGAGGGVLLWGKWVKLNGSINAKGGDGGVGTSTANDDGGGGSGGRIKVLYNAHLSGSLSTSVAGGKGGPYGTAAPGEDGDAGTVFKGFHYYDMDSIIPYQLTLQFSDADRRICKGTPFTVTARQGFTKYTFFKNSTQVSSGSSNVFTYTNLNNKDSLSVVAIFSACFTDQKFVIVGVDTLPVIKISGDTSICIGDTAKMLATGAKTYQWTGGPKTDSWSLIPSSSNTYKVTGKDNNGCSDTAVHAISVYTYPNYTGATGATICAGDSATLEVSGAKFVLWEKTWSTDKLVVKPPTTRNYYYEVYDFPRCKITDSVEVIVNPLPNVYISGKSSVCPGGSVTMGANGAFFYEWSTGGTYFLETVSPKVATTYWVKGKDDKGCFSIVSKTITINTPATISITGDMEICKGESTLLTASGGVSYSWGSGGKKPSETVTPVITTSYPVVSIDSNGCKDTTVATVVVNNLPVVTLDLPAAIDTVCLNDSPWPLSGASPAGGTYKGKGISAGAFTPAQAGVGKHQVYYTYTDGKGCSDSANVFIVVDACARITGYTAGNTIRIFPNPSNGNMVTVEARSGNYCLRNASGQIVFSFRIEGETLEIPVQNWSNGVYFLQSLDQPMPEVKLILLR